MEVEQYLKKETIVLVDVISKQKIRQNAEYTRLYRQVGELEVTGAALEKKRGKAVVRVAAI